ncbi:MAG TPA: hypothetical protein VFJ85_09225 [Acidimicrobiales bacterium]|nr:hypothetical protein [Acidimicrobiales bacterium]
MGPVSLRLDLRDIQGNILRGYPSRQAAYLFFAVPTVDAGRALLTYLAGVVRDASDWGSEPPLTAVNVAVTFAGLAALGVEAAVLDALPDEFRQPMAVRAATMLDDRHRGAPEHWDGALGKGAAHVLVTVNQTGPDDEAFAGEVATVLAEAAEAGATLVYDQRAAGLPSRREHFGWADGFGQPAIEGVTGDPAGGGSPQADGTWKLVKVGEFVHGYPDEDGLTTSGPTAALLRHGTFMVWRKLHQDIVGFRRRLRADALAYGKTLPDDPPLDPDQLYELVAAKIVGRWRDGVPIEEAERRAPGEDTKLGDAELPGRPDNDFRYGAPSDGGGDLSGAVCPVGAHIRRTNPRDALGWKGGSQMTSTHRIVRRGMPYGDFKPFEEGETDDGKDRGLIFICFNASIERQFEVVQRQWCNDGNAFALGNEKDYLLGDHLLDPATGGPPSESEPDGRLGCSWFSVQRPQGAPFPFSQGPPLVWTLGSEYLLMPGIGVLRQLAAGQF